jgi:F420-dependent oxidoreductase-like protein
MRFGLFLAQHHHDWPSIVEEFRLADELGYDHAWGHDHFLSTARDDGGEGWMLEAWSVLAGVAALTSRVRLGLLVTGNTYRHPAMLAKQAATVDHISGGRLILGMGAGWHEREHEMFGYPFPSARERVDMLEESLQVLDLLQTQERPSFEGKHYRLKAAIFEPKPLQKPHIPLLVGTTGKRMIGITARHADMWDIAAHVEDLPGKVRMLDEACEEAGRDPESIRRNVHVSGAAVPSNPDAFLAFVEQHRALGFTDFVTDLPPPEKRDALRRIATEVIPSLRGA